MSAAYQVLDLILLPNASVWHVATDDDTTLCNQKKFGAEGRLEVGLDPNVVRLHGKRVCTACRRLT